VEAPRNLRERAGPERAQVELEELTVWTPLPLLLGAPALRPESSRWD
jgi:hypothetical protein